MDGNQPEDLDTVLTEMEAGVPRPALEAKALRRPPSAGDAAAVKQAVVQIGNEVLRQGEVIDRMAKSAGRPAGRSELERRISLAEVKRDRPPGLERRWPGAAGAVNVRQQLLRQHKQAVIHYLRTGRGEETAAALQQRALAAKALSTELNPDGGYIVLPDRGNPLDALLIQQSPMRQLATIQVISSGEFVRPVNMKGTQSGWIGERETRPETDAPVFGEDRFPVMEVFAQPAATQTLLDDAMIDLEAYLAGEVVEEFARQESAAFISGDGNKKPRGLLSYDFVTDHSQWAHGKFRLIETGVSGAFPPTNPTGSPPTMPDNVLYDVLYAVKAQNRPNASWIMNSNTVGTIRKLRDIDGRPLWVDGIVSAIADRQPARLLGYPVTVDEYMPDIGIDTVPIGFGDWRKTYLIVDRMGVRVLRDPYTAKPYVLFYSTKRVGGGAQYFDAAAFLRFSA